MECIERVWKEVLKTGFKKFTKIHIETAKNSFSKMYVKKVESLEGEENVKNIY